ncbi:hypothetical protein RKE25_22165 (plasmid) [Dyella sp. BiH032]|uniref:hypothetical protein n=1 Tax=Dyella sp. BiH032 TaxID=3075430 RepID=UPI002892FCEF|nr:hypothetical protein [Dyella sp. BiH032]WNL48437.1 hypothetical protein RKE25_22165 [Dyella sp. BiH032]
MKKHTLGAILAISLVASGLVSAQAAWDGYVEVPAKASEPHRWYTCRKGETFPGNASSGAPKCVKAGAVDTYQGDAVPMSLQEMLDEHFRAPAGYKAVAVGPLPVMVPRFGVKDGAVYIAYRLERSGF